MVKSRLSATEKVTLILGFVILTAAFFLFYTNKSQFDNYVKEDGLVEWVTVLGLLAGSLVCLSRFTKLFSKRSKWFLFVTLCLGLLLFFFAGEEISWGQRLMGIATPEYFKKHNAQQETNLHNLIVGGVKLNKLIFSVVLVAALGIYLVVVPILYDKSLAAKKFLDRSGIPVPRLYQTLAFLLVFGLTSLIRDGKNAEILECVGALLVFLIILRPVNTAIYKGSRSTLYG